jgi:hypothetical protein
MDKYISDKNQMAQYSNIKYCGKRLTYEELDRARVVSFIMTSTGLSVATPKLYVPSHETKS